MKTIIYHTEQSPPARAVRMIVHILKLDVEWRAINPVLREQDSPAMRKLNPMRTVPFIDEGDFSLGDSHAIVLYFIEKYGKPEHAYLYPKDVRIRATVNQRLHFDCGILFNRLRAVMGPTYLGQMTEMPIEVVGGIKNAYGMVEDYLSVTKYLAHDEMTVADISAISTMSSLDGLVPVNEKRYPKTRQWLNTMYAKDFVITENEPGCKLHVSLLFEIMEINKTNKQKAKL